MHADDRAQSVQIGFAFVAIVVVAVIVNLLAPAMTGLDDAATDTVDNDTALTGLDWLQTTFDVLPFIAVGIVAAGTIAISVFQTRGGR